jgi:hypothetical protein
LFVGDKTSLPTIFRAGAGAAGTMKDDFVAFYRAIAALF